MKARQFLANLSLTEKMPLPVAILCHLVIFADTLVNEMC